jgi:hypothetical protein
MAILGSAIANGQITPSEEPPFSGLKGGTRVTRADVRFVSCERTDRPGPKSDFVPYCPKAEIGRPATSTR